MELPHGWRPVATDPPPVGVPVLGLCDYTGVRSVTVRRDDIYFRRWDFWRINHPTHWQDLPAALPKAAAPAMAPGLGIGKFRGDLPHEER